MLVHLHLVGEYVPIFPTRFLGFRIRWLHKLYSLSGVVSCVIVTNVLFELCNDTRTRLKTLLQRCSFNTELRAALYIVI